MVAPCILVIDDESEIRQLVGEYLETVGYTVHTAASGSEALSLLDSRPDPIDLAFVDWNLPGISGRDLIQAIGTRFPETRIILTTGDPPETLPTGSASLGWSDVVLKPFRLRHLRDSIAKALAPEGSLRTGP